MATIAKLNDDFAALLHGLRCTGHHTLADTLADGVDRRDPIVQTALYAVCSGEGHAFRLRANAFTVHEVIADGTWPHRA